jgi:hypothetical protein
MPARFGRGAPLLAGFARGGRRAPALICRKSAAKTKGDLTVAFHTLAGQSAQVRTFNCSLSRTEPSVKGKRTFVMVGCGPGEIRTHDLRSANLVLYPAELRGRYLFRLAGIKLFRYPVRRTHHRSHMILAKQGVRRM